jgi:hypothetical protein
MAERDARSRLKAKGSDANAHEARAQRKGIFDPKAIATLLEAYDSLVADLGLRTLAEKEKAAGIILHLAQEQTELDAAKLRDTAADLLNEGATKSHS